MKIPEHETRRTLRDLFHYPLNLSRTEAMKRDGETSISVWGFAGRAISDLEDNVMEQCGEPSTASSLYHYLKDVVNGRLPP